MNEIGFKAWLSDAQTNKKVQSDMVSRLKALQRELGNCDIDAEYKKDTCRMLFAALENKGENDTMRSFGDVKLPVGQYSLSVYRYALRTYIRYLDSQT